MKNVVPIQTRYKGYHFRSRLEARWAVFFDALGIPWEYEPEGFALPDGGYLPDFRLFGSIFAEVKPISGGQRMVENELERLIPLVQAGHSLTLICGVPQAEWYPVMDFDPDAQDGWRMEWLGWNESARRARPWFRYCGEVPPVPRDEGLDISRPLLKAVIAARSARFEYGETPR